MCIAALQSRDDDVGRMYCPVMWAAVCHAHTGDVWVVRAISSDGEHSYFSELHIPFRHASKVNPDSIGALSAMLPASGIKFRETPGDCESPCAAAAIVAARPDAVIQRLTAQQRSRTRGQTRSIGITLRADNSSSTWMRR